MSLLDLKKIREDFGFTQAEFAAKLGLNRKTIMGYENNPEKLKQSKAANLRVLIEAIRIEREAVLADNSKKLHLVKTNEDLIAEGVARRVKPLLNLLTKQSDTMNNLLDEMNKKLHANNCELEAIKLLLELDKK